MGDENEFYQYPLQPNPADNNNAFAMSVKLSSELFELISLHSFTNLQAVFGDNKGKIFVDDKIFEFQCTPEKTSVDVLHFVGEEGAFKEIGQVKRKLLLVSQKLSVAAENLKINAEKAENDRKKKKSLVLDDVNNKLKSKTIKRTNTLPTTTTQVPTHKDTTSKPILPIPKTTLPAPTPKPILPLPNGTLTLPKKIATNLANNLTNSNNSTPNASTPNPSSTSTASTNSITPKATRAPKTTKPKVVTVIPSGLSGVELKEAIIHTLALKEVNTTRFPKEATHLLTKVATVKPPGLLYLKDEYFRDVRVDTWENYTPEEREKVRSRVNAALSRLPPLPEKLPLPPQDTPQIINTNNNNNTTTNNTITNTNTNNNNNNNNNNNPTNNNNNNVSNSPPISDNVITAINVASVSNAHSITTTTPPNYINGINLPIPKKRKTEESTKPLNSSEKPTEPPILQSTHKPLLKTPTQQITNHNNVNNNNNHNNSNHNNHSNHSNPHTLANHSNSHPKENGLVSMNGHSKTTNKIIVQHNNNNNNNNNNSNNLSFTPPNSPPKSVHHNHNHHKENGKENVTQNGFHFEPITDSAMYEKCSQEYTSKYDRYTALHTFLEQNSEMFKQIGDRWQHTTDPKEKDRLGEEIAKFFNERQTQVSHASEEFHSLHKQLRALKQRMNDYLGKKKRKL